MLALSIRRFAPAIALVSSLIFPLGQAHAAEVVTVYSADGLKDGKPNWFDTVFDVFTKETGIKVQYVEAGSGVVVNRIMAERANPQADVLVTLPPFMQRAAADGLLQPVKLQAASAIPASTRSADDLWYPLVNNYACWIYNAKALKQAPASYETLLDPQFKNRIQYSTPGQAGDGTAVMLQTFKMYGSKDAGFDYLKKLQANNLGPSSSTGRLAGLVNKGELLVANGDVQMNFAQMRQDPNIRIFFPKAPDGKRYTMALPYDIGLVKGAPHGDAGRKLVAFLLSKQAQGTVYSLAGRFPVRVDITESNSTAGQLNKIMAGVEVWTPDWNQVTKDLNSDVARWHQVTGS